MAVWSEVRYSALFPGVDLSAEHYHPDKLVSLRLLTQPGRPVSSVVRSIRQLVIPKENDETPVLDLGAANNHVVQAADAQTEDRVSTKKVVRAGDVLISRLRSYLKQVAVVPPEVLKAYVSTEFIVLRGLDDTDIAFLLPFLLCGPVQTVLAWSQDGNEHPRFNETVLLSLTIPSTIEAIAGELNALVAQAASDYARGRNAFSEAEAMLTFALGLDKLDLTSRLFCERTYEAVSAAGRLDAEYHNPRAQNLIAALSRAGLTIADVAKLATRRFRPVGGVEFQYIEISDVGGSGTAESTPVMGEEAPSRAQWVVQAGDVITTTVRPIRRLSAIVTEDQGGFVCSSGFAVLKPMDIEPELLLVYLRLPLVCELLDLHTTASMYPAISTVDLMRIPISLPDAPTRAKIVAKVKESFGARREAKRLLDGAKAMVEEAVLSAKPTND
jgi:hypothetical protein